MEQLTELTALARANGRHMPAHEQADQHHEDHGTEQQRDDRQVVVRGDRRRGAEAG